MERIQQNNISTDPCTIVFDYDRSIEYEEIVKLIRKTVKEAYGDKVFIHKIEPVRPRLGGKRP